MRSLQSVVCMGREHPETWFQIIRENGRLIVRLGASAQAALLRRALRTTAFLEFRCPFEKALLRWQGRLVGCAAGNKGTLKNEDCICGTIGCGLYDCLLRQRSPCECLHEGNSL